MTMNEYLLLGLGQGGLPVLCGVVLIAAIGVPLPATLLLLAAGALVTQGELNMWWVIGLTTGAAVLGDQLGYAIGRWGSHRLLDRVSRWGGGADRLAQAEQIAKRRGGSGIFFSRWLLTPLGPVVNLTSGVARYSWLAFLCFDVAGELLWVSGYMTLGWMFSSQIQTISSALGNVSWAMIGLLAVLGLVRFMLNQQRLAGSLKHLLPQAVRLFGCAGASQRARRERLAHPAN